MSGTALKAPFPYFGGKSRVADLVWSRLGEVDNYVEPFAGTLAVLLRRPSPGKIETVNDRNHFIVNFWRAVAADPDTVAEHADWPVTEADLHARHRWLMLGEASIEFGERVNREPEYFDAKVAGWWVWGQCCWIGGGWCSDHGATVGGDRKQIMPQLSNDRGVLSTQLPDMPGDAGAFGRGVASSAGHNKRPRLATHDAPGTGVHAKPPRIDSRATGAGVNGESLSEGRPQLGDAYDIGRGVNGNGSSRLCDERRAWLVDWMHRLQDRLRLVRVCYGHWSRICDSKTTMTRLGTTGAFLDPPYAKSLDRLEAWKRHLAGDGDPPASTSSSNRADGLYAGDESQDIDRLVAEVNGWCRKWGADKRVRIALCGYEGEHDDLEAEGWTVEAWKAHGGYANRNEGNENKHRERIWFSPGCQSQSIGQRNLF